MINKARIQFLLVLFIGQINETRNGAGDVFLFDLA